MDDNKRFEELENYEFLYAKMRDEGFHYCFNGYSKWDEIEDKKFHKLRKKYLKSAKKLKEFVDNKLNELNEY
jgi:hypothetical protein